MTDQPRNEQGSLGLHEGLQKFEAQWKRLQMRLGAGRFLITVVVLLGIAGALDGALGLEGRSRWTMTLFFYLGVGLSAWAVWLRDLFRPLTPENVAWMIESVHPELNEKLISAVELEKEKGRTVSQAMIVQMIRETELDIGKVDPVRDLAPPKWLRVLPYAVAGLVVVLMAVPGFYLPLRMKRIVLPASHDAAVTTVRLQWVTLPPSQFPEDGEIQVAVTRSEERAEPVVLEIQGERNRRIPLKWNPETQAFEGAFEGPDHDVVLFARSGKASTRRVSMSPMLRPWIEALTLTVIPPEYTGAEVQEFDRFPHEVFAVTGSGIQVQLTANEALASASLETESGRVDLTLNPDGTAGGELKPEAGGELVLRLMDQEGLAPKESPRLRLRLVPDQPPQLAWVSPQNDVLMREGDTLPLVWNVEDDYGATESRIWIQKNEDPPVIKAVESVEDDYRFDFSEWVLGGGDRLRVRAMARDALGQEGETPMRTLSVAGGLDHPDAQAYLRELEQVEERLKARTADVEALQDARRELFEAAEYQTPTAIENLEYNRSRWELLSREMDQELNMLRSGLDGLHAQVFFPGGDDLLKLLSDYAEQERRWLFRIDPAELQEESGVEGVWELGVPALAELRLRAGFALPALQAEKLATMVALAAPHKDAVSRELLMELRHRAVVWAQEHVPERVEALQALDLSVPEAPTSGLIREIWKGRGSYMLDPGVSGEEARKVPAVNHRDLSSMGLKRDQRVSVRWQGTLRVAKAGNYGFELESDDGSRLYVNHQLVVKNDGNHGMQKKQGVLRLSPGVHPIQIVYFNSGGQGGIVFRWRTPGRSDWKVVPGQVLGSQFDVGAAGLISETRSMVREMEGQAYDLAELKRWSDEIRRRLKESAPSLLEQLMEQEEPTLAEHEVMGVKEEVQALKSRAETENSERLLQLAEEGERAAEQEDREAAIEVLKAAEQVLADEQQQAWEEGMRKELAKVKEVVKQSEGLRTSEEPLQRGELEQMAEIKQTMERLKTLADQAPEAGGDRKLQEAIKKTAWEAERLAQALQQAVSNPEGIQQALSKAEAHIQTAENRLDLVAEAAEQSLDKAEDRLNATRRDEAEQMAELLERLEDVEELDPVAALEALEAEQAALENLVASMREPLDLQREPDGASTAGEVRDRRLADAVERQAGQKLEEAEQALRQKDASQAAEALADASRQLENLQPLLEAQERAKNLALTEREEAGLSNAIREATDSVLPEELSRAYNAWEEMVEAKRNVEKLSEELQQLQTARKDPKWDPFAEKVARTANALQEEETNDSWGPQDQKAMDDALRRLQPMRYAADRAEVAEQSANEDSERRKSLEQLSRRAEEFQMTMERHAGPESRRLQNMAEAVERQARAEDGEGAQQTVEAMERQIEQWAKEAGEARRTQREERTQPREVQEPAAHVAQAAEALERAQAFQEQVQQPLKHAPQQAERGEFERLARTLDATGEAAELAEKAERLEQQKRELQGKVLQQAMREKDRNKKKRLERASERLAANDLRDASDQLKNAGQRGLQKQLENLRQEGRELAEAVKEKAEEVAKETGPGEQAQQAVAKAVDALQQEELALREASNPEQGEGASRTAGETASSEEKQEVLKDARSLAEKAQELALRKKWKEASKLARESLKKAEDALRKEEDQFVSAQPPVEQSSEGQGEQNSPQGQQGPQGQVAQQAQPPTPDAPSEGPSVRPDQAPRADVSPPLSNAVELLNTAEQALREQEPSLAGESLDQAVAALSNAEQSMAAMMRDLAQASSSAQASQSSPSTSQGQGASTTLSAAQGGSGGEGGASKESERGLDQDPNEVPEGEAWEGAVSDLVKGDRQRGSNRYSPYYRRAMQQYMQDLQKEQKE